MNVKTASEEAPDWVEEEAQKKKKKGQKWSSIYSAGNKIPPNKCTNTSLCKYLYSCSQSDSAPFSEPYNTAWNDTVSPDPESIDVGVWSYSPSSWQSMSASSLNFR